MASELQPVLQLKDVYDIAQNVGEHFQLLIQRFGNASFSELVNIVVNVLEHLETFVQENQKLQARLCKLLLDNDKFLKDNEKLKAESQHNSVSSSCSLAWLCQPMHAWLMFLAGYHLKCPTHFQTGLAPMGVLCQLFLP